MVCVEPLQELVAREHASGRRSEGAEKAEFNRGEIERAPVQFSAVAWLVDDEAAHGSVRGAAPAPQDRFDARDELAHAERLAHIVVRAELEADEAIDFLDFRRHHHYRDVAETAQ